MSPSLSLRPARGLFVLLSLGGRAALADPAPAADPLADIPPELLPSLDPEDGDAEAYEIVETIVVPERQAATEVKLSKGEVDDVPGTFGDPVRVVETLPGLARAPGGLGGALIVRGANPADSGLYIDGVEVPLIYHFGGLTSVVNPAFLDEVKFMPGGFGVDYGRATAGIVSVTTPFLKCNQATGAASVDPIDADIYACVPLGQWRLAAAARRSYIDALLPLFLPDSAEPGKSVTTVTPSFMDYQVKAQRLWAEQELQIFAFGSHDALKVLRSSSAEDADQSLRGQLGFHRLQLRHTYHFSPRTRLDSQITPGFMTTGFRESSQDLSVDGKQLVDMYTVAWRETLWLGLSEAMSLKLGIDHQLLGWTADFVTDLPTLARQFPTPVWDRTRSNPWRARDLNLSQGYFAELTLAFTPDLTVTPGVRLSHLVFDQTARTVLEPRLAVRYRLDDETTLKAAAGVYHKLSDIFSGVLVSGFGQPRLRAERAVHAVTGLERSFSSALAIGLEGFYVRRDNLPSPTDDVLYRGGRAEPMLFDSSGTGRSYGVELLVRRPERQGRRFSGWIAYTLSRSTRRDRSPDGIAADQFAGVNAGTPRVSQLPEQPQTHVSPFDQPHILSAVGRWQLPWQMSFGFRFQLVSGNPVTPLERGQAFYDADADGYQVQGGTVTRNSSRLPTFHRLDVRLDRRWQFEAFTLTAYLEVMNAYNRRPVEGFAYDYRYRTRAEAPGLPVLPVLGVKGEF